jgi:hypothetical protein
MKEDVMPDPLSDKINSYSVYVAQSSVVNYSRSMRLSLESGGTAFIAFPKVRPTDWLQFNESGTILYMTADEFADVYRLVQTENRCSSLRSGC